MRPPDYGLYRPLKARRDGSVIWLAALGGMLLGAAMTLASAWLFTILMLSFTSLAP